MSPRTVSHTKSTSGRTHQLNVYGEVVTLRYKTTPKYDDQVQGDLIRKYRETHPRHMHDMIRPINDGRATVDPALDAEEWERDHLTPEQVATAAVNAVEEKWPDLVLSRAQLEIVIAAVVTTDRKTR